MIEIPLFLFGVFITLLVSIGVVLAVVELRQAHAPQMPRKESAPTPHPNRKTIDWARPSAS
jgi:hypothetical protein